VQPALEHRRLAEAFLALSDEPEPRPARSRLRTTCAAAAAVVLALAAPLTWDGPAATASTKSPVAEEADDDGDAA
jgi:hypothetical protein